MKLGTRISALTLGLSLVPLVLVSVLSIQVFRSEMNKTVQQDYLNMLTFIRGILVARENLVQSSEICEELVWAMEARQLEKDFAVSEDKAIVGKWRTILEKIKKSAVYTGDVPTAMGAYEKRFDSFTQGKLANINDLTKAGQELETQIKKWIKTVRKAQHQALIKDELIGPLLEKGSRDSAKGIVIGKTGHLVFMKSDGTLAGHPALEGQNLAANPEMKQICAERNGSLKYQRDGIQRFAFYGYFEPWDWIMIIDVPQDEVISTGRIVRYGTAVIICLLVIVLVLTIIYSRSLARPLHGMVNTLTGVVTELGQGATDMTDASARLADSSSKQASQLEETSSSLNEMAAMTKETAENAHSADACMQETAKVVNAGSEAVGKMTEAMARIKASSAQTVKIIRTIDEIAFQTNLLALNAAVEAARAGEAGKGFAVVAEEVRNLARRSTEAAKSTGELLASSQTQAAEGENVSQNLQRVFGEIQSNSEKAAALVKAIASASKEQSQGIEQLNSAMSEMDSAIQGNAADADGSSQTARQLSEHAAELNRVADQLKSVVEGGSQTSFVNDAATVQAQVHNEEPPPSAPATALPKPATPQLPDRG